VDYSTFRRSQSKTLLVTFADRAQDDIVDSLLVEPDFGDGIVNALPKLVLQSWACRVKSGDARHTPA
jgi:hypothetical protein